MAQDTFGEIWNRVLLRCPSLSPKLAQDFVVNAFRRLAEMRRWSWLVKYGQFIAPDAYNTGTVSVVTGTTTVTGSGSAWTSAMIGRQFRVGLAAPIYTITQVTSATSLELNAAFGGPTGAGVGYSIYQCYFQVPSDFYQFISLWDPSYAWALYLDVTQDELNRADPQRANSGNSYLVAFQGYTASQVGLVNQPLTVNGSGNIPVAGGVFTGPYDATFTIEITTGGVSGTAVFKWKKNTGSYTTGVTTSVTGAAQDLQDGTTIAFPTGFTYTSGNIFIVQCTAIANSGVAVYELYPHQQSSHSYPFYYQARWQDLNDPNVVIPRSIHADVLVEMAMEDVCLYPGPSTDKPNPQRSLQNAAYYGERARKMLNELENADDNIWEQQMAYQAASPNVMAFPFGDSKWLQSHAL